MKAPPPTPELCGSTSDSIACTAIAASTALPPRFSTFEPGLRGERIGGDDERLGGRRLRDRRRRGRPARRRRAQAQARAASELAEQAHRRSRLAEDEWRSQSHSAKKRAPGSRESMARQLEHFDNLVSMFLTRARGEGRRSRSCGPSATASGGRSAGREAARQVAALADSLKRIGLEPGDRVMLVSENRPEWLIADLGIMAAGCVTVPTYTTNTDARSRAHPRQFGRPGGDRLEPEAGEEPDPGGADLDRMPSCHRHRATSASGQAPGLGRLSITGPS